MFYKATLFLTWWSPPSQFAGDRTHEWGCARLFLTKFSATTPPSKMLLWILKKLLLELKNFRKSANFSISFWIFCKFIFYRFLSIFTKFSEFWGIFGIFWKSRFFAISYRSRVSLWVVTYRRTKKGSFLSILWGSTQVFSIFHDFRTKVGEKRLMIKFYWCVVMKK